MAIQAKDEFCARCHLLFGTHEVRVAHNGKPYHEDCVREVDEKPSRRFRISELLMVIDRTGIRVVPKHHFGRG